MGPLRACLAAPLATRARDQGNPVPCAPQGPRHATRHVHIARERPERLAQRCDQ